MREALIHCAGGWHHPRGGAGRHLAAALGTDLHRHRQIRPVPDARRQSRRGRDALADGAGAERPGPVPPPPVFLLGVAGAALFYGDALITPAISVLSAVEGLKLVTPVLEPYVVPITVAILLGLFAAQRHGTGQGRGAVRPDHRLVWFLVMAGSACSTSATIWACSRPSTRSTPSAFLAVAWRASASSCWAACSSRSPAPRRSTPTWAISAARPIQAAWIGLVFPALALNYLGQARPDAQAPGGDGQPVLPDGARAGRCCRWSCWRPSPR